MGERSNVPLLSPVLALGPAKQVIIAGPSYQTGVNFTVLPVLWFGPAVFLAHTGPLLPTGATLTVMPVLV